MFEVTLPWPPVALNPNSRTHWAKRAEAAAKTRRDARIACMGAGCRALPWQTMHVALTFRAPTARAYDLDNALARCKSTLDGVADATGIDDQHWTYSMSRGAPVKGGAVIIQVKEGENP